jgi:regulator of protease activity HflC (stomatin/prohibitin superfamily)
MLKKTILVSALSLITACSSVPAGHVGVIVNTYGEDKGISEKTVGVGRYYLGFFKDMYLFPTFLQNYTWSGNESFSMQTKEGLTIKSDMGITYYIKPDNVVRVFQKYRLGVEEITNTFLHNMVRDAVNQVASTMTIEELYSLKKEEFITKVSEIVKPLANETGINVDKIYLIGSFVLPDTVIKSINSKIEATQHAMRVENEVATTKAEAQKRFIQANAEAQANIVISKSLTPEYLKYQALQKWDGVLPKVASEAIPFINFKE